MRNLVLDYFQSTQSSYKNCKVLRKALTAIYLFDFLDRLKNESFPDDWFEIMKNDMAGLDNFSSLIENRFDIAGDGSDWDDNEQELPVDLRTGAVYFNLWKNFNKEEYYQQTLQLLEQRFTRNQLDVTGFKSGLDAGCGGGRYTLALKKSGIHKMTGVDISPDSVSFATKMNHFPEDEVIFKQASVLELPFADKSFDFVFSNGVLHHTTDINQGLRELNRVLQPGGQGWLYLYGGKETLFWDIVDFCRAILSDVPQSYMQILMKIMGYPPGRIFHRADFWYVPINERYFAAEVDEMLKDTGFTDSRRLTRGSDHDWDEIIYSNPSIDPYIYGEGEMRFWLQKAL